jgi:predicted alpha/beta hydrolase family esterase
MKRVIFVHGFYAREKYFDPDTDLINFKDYTPWLLKQLTVHGYLANAPLMPKPYAPVYEEWKREFERYDFDEDTVLIGQSLGGGFLARWLSESDVKVGKVLLVAPAIYNQNNPRPDAPDTPVKQEFGTFEIDPNLARKTAGLTVFESTDDAQGIKNAYKLLRDNLNDAKFIELENRGHFTVTTAGEINRQFPELLEEILR